MDGANQWDRLGSVVAAAVGTQSGLPAGRPTCLAAYQQAGRPADASKQYQKALADGERYLGPDHPVTRTVRENLRAARP